jgi:hypothetical protein
MELQAITGQLYILNGVMQATGAPGLLAQPAPAKATHGREKDFLFVHLTLSGQAADTAQLAQSVLDSISAIFYQTPGSVTAALRTAIIETNQKLLALNLSGSGPVHEGAITCTVQRGDELYMAQVGEAIALVGHNFGIERLPPDRPERVTPLGRTAGLDIRYFHNWLQSGDMLLMADPRLAYLPSQALEPVLIDTTIEEGLEQLASVIGSDSARVILIEFTDEAPGYMPDASRPVLTTVASSRTLTPPTGQPIRATAVVQHPPAAERAPALPNVDVEVVEATARKATSQAAMGLSRATGGLAAMLTQLRPPRPRRASQPDDYRGRALPALLAVLIPVVIAVVVSSVFLQRGRVMEYGEIKQAINQNLALASQASGDPQVATDHYNEALRLITEAAALRPNDNDLDRLRGEALNGLDNLSGVARLQARLLYEFAAGTELISIALGDELNGGIYLLDQANNLLYQQKTDDTFVDFTSDQPEVILFGEQVVGSHVVGQLVDLLWRPRGTAVSRDGIAALDSSGALITFYPNFSDTRTVPLGLASDWQQPEAITTFNERLYILDTGVEQIWRYFAEGDGFTFSENQRTVEFVESAQLGQVADLAIYSEDGSVLLLYTDGRMRRYVNGRLLWSEGELEGNGLETPLLRPSAIHIGGRGLNSSVFVLDQGTARLVQFSLGGIFLAQYRALDLEGQELFVGASDFAVLENPLRIFVINENRLYLVTQ